MTLDFKLNKPRLVRLPSWVTNFAEKRKKNLLFTSNTGGSFLSVPEILNVNTNTTLGCKGIVCIKLPKVRTLEGDFVLRIDAIIWKWVEFIYMNWREMAMMPRITSASWVKTLFRCIFSTDEVPFSEDLFQ